MNIKVQNWFVERQEEWNKKRRNGPVREDISPLRNGKADSSNVKESSSKGKEDAEVPRGIISVLEKKIGAPISSYKLCFLFVIPNSNHLLICVSYLFSCRAKDSRFD